MSTRFALFLLPFVGVAALAGSFGVAGKWRTVADADTDRRALNENTSPAIAGLAELANGEDLTVRLEAGQSVSLRVDPRVWGGEMATLTAADSGKVTLRVDGAHGAVRAVLLSADAPCSSAWTGIELFDEDELAVVTSMAVERVGGAMVVSLFCVLRSDLLYRVRGAQKSWSEGRLPSESLASTLEGMFAACDALPRDPNHRGHVLDVVRGQA